MNSQPICTPVKALRRLLTREPRTQTPPAPLGRHMPLLVSVHRWLDDPEGGGRFSHQRDGIRVHDSTCWGLEYAWLPRKGGYSDSGGIYDCDGGCNVMFHIEGVRLCFEECEEDMHYYCACCRAKMSECPCETKLPEPTS